MAYARSASVIAKMMVSLICTVRNEADNIGALLESMLAQTRLPDEIVVNDCGSQDDTPVIVERYIAAGHPIRLVRGGHNIPSGRNNAIRHARGPLIASTDAGLTLDSLWLERIIGPLERDEADVVGGFFRPAPQSFFELVLAATNYPDAHEIEPAHFLPFGKSVAFHKAAWEDIGGYPEWASHCEDLLFDLALRRAGYRFAFVPDALVLFRPRSSFGSFARQYFFYARGDGLANLWPKRHMLRYSVYLATSALVVAARRRPWLLTPIVLGVCVYSCRPVRRLSARAPALSCKEWLLALCIIPLIRLVGDLAKIIGYPVGVWQRLRTEQRKKS